MSSFISNSLRAEVRANLRLAAPLIGAQLANVGMGSVDAAFAGRLGPQALAAVAVGVNLNFIFLVFAMGVLMACSPIVAQLRGAGRPPLEAAIFLAQARRLALAIALLWCLVLNLVAAPVLGSLGLDQATVLLAVKFEHALSFSAFGYSLWFALRFGAEGAGVMRPILLAGLVGLAANILLDWLLLFGHFGLPALGAPGCGLATTLSSLLMAFALSRASRSSPRLAPYFVASRASSRASSADVPGAWAVLRLGLPISLILLAEGGAFALSALANARFGSIAVGGYQVAFNIASLAFMIPLGVAQATTVRVGLAAGAGDAAALRFRGATGMGLALLNACSNAAIMVFFGGAMVAVYTKDLVIAAQATHFLLLVAAFQLFDGLQVAANGALRGVKDTRLPAAITLIAYWVIGVPAAVVLAFGIGNRAGIGPDGLWWGLTAGLGVTAFGLSWRFVRKTRVESIVMRSGNKHRA